MKKLISDLHQKFTVDPAFAEKYSNTNFKGFGDLKFYKDEEDEFEVIDGDNNKKSDEEVFEFYPNTINKFSQYTNNQQCKLKTNTGSVIQNHNKKPEQETQEIEREM